MINEILAKKISEIDKSEIEAIGLMGSYSRGEAKKYSDVDIVCIMKKDSNKKSTCIGIIEDKYVVTSYVTLEEMEECFTEPESATKNILGLQQVKVLYDPNETFKNLKKRALEFKWAEALQLKANEIVSKQLLGWIEEVHKALQGLICDDAGRMLNGLFGLTYGIFNVVQIQKGILLNGENSFYKNIVEYFGIDSSFAKLSDKAFGIGQAEGIKDRIIAGLFLFDEVTEQFIDILREEDKPAITLAKYEIRNELKNRGIVKI